MNKIKLFLLSLLMFFLIGFATTNIATASSTQDKNITTIKSETITKYVKSNGGLILRKEAHSKGAKVGMLKDGSKVTVHSTTKFGWSHVTAGKLQGYANDSYLFTKNATNTSTQTTSANSTSKGIGNVKGTVVWKYNDFIGIKGDGGAKIFLFSKSAKYKNYTKQELFDWLEGKTDIPNIYRTQVDANGNYSFNDVPAGNYIGVISSRNTNRWISDGLDPYKSLQSLFGTKNYEIFEANNLLLYKHLVRDLEVKAKGTTDFSTNFGYTSY